MDMAVVIYKNRDEILYRGDGVMPARQIAAILQK